MEEKANPWKANFTNGLVLGLAGIIFSLVLWFMDLTFNRSLPYLFIPISMVMLYLMIKSYRDNHLHGRITYGQSLGTGMIIYLYYAIISAIFAYLLFTVIDPGLIDKGLAMSEEQMRASGRVPEEQMETAMSFTKKFMRPEIMAPFSIIVTMFQGLLISLFISIFTRKEGNPLVDAELK